MSAPTCPVCGKAWSEIFTGGDGELGGRDVDHIECVETARAGQMLEKERRQEAEVALAAKQATIAALEAEVERLTAERDHFREKTEDHIERGNRLEAKLAELEARMRSFWLLALTAVRFYDELGDEYDCKAGMQTLSEAAHDTENVQVRP